MAKKVLDEVGINLLPGDDLEGRPGGIFLKWALTWGKRIVIVTELIVILAFLSRFWLDTTVANNSDLISQKQAIVASEDSFETQFRTVTNRIVQAKTIEAQVSPLVVYDTAQALIPPQIAVNQFVVTNEKINFGGQSDAAAIAQLVSNFKNSPDFSGVNVEKISKSSDDPNIIFTLSADYVHH
ncbi:MAG: hypothetical protein M1484_04990 [Patescibacteria group bacterium]|nr:hypothetical protein [Patescibacteria group bacterium]